MIAGMESDTSGEIFIDGKHISHLEPQRTLPRDGFSGLCVVPAHECREEHVVCAAAR